MAVNVDVALRRGDSWLLIVRGAAEKHAAGLLSLVGGTLDGSDPVSDALEATARREVEEEVGLRVDSPLTYVESTFFVSDTGTPVLNVVFRADVDPAAEPVVAAPDEVAAVVWRTLADLESDSTCPPWTLQSVQRAARVA